MANGEKTPIVSVRPLFFAVNKTHFAVFLPTSAGERRNDDSRGYAQIAPHGFLRTVGKKKTCAAQHTARLFFRVLT